MHLQVSPLVCALVVAQPWRRTSVRIQTSRSSVNARRPNHPSRDRVASRGTVYRSVRRLLTSSLPVRRRPPRMARQLVDRSREGRPARVLVRELRAVRGQQQAAPLKMLTRPLHEPSRTPRLPSWGTTITRRRNDRRQEWLAAAAAAEDAGSAAFSVEGTGPRPFIITCRA